MAVDDAVGSRKNQGGAPFCVSHGTTEAYETLERLEGNPNPVPKSRLWVMYMAHALEHEDGNAEKHAKHFRDVVIPAMTALRESGDAIEIAMPHESWPLATYREMLFIK